MRSLYAMSGLVGCGLGNASCAGGADADPDADQLADADELADGFTDAHTYDAHSALAVPHRDRARRRRPL
jgi:hypothetical protein